MKNLLVALLPLFALATGCAASPDAAPEDTNVVDAEQELGASGLQKQVYRGTIDAGGRRLTIEVELATTRAGSTRTNSAR
jgi:hypothetical protein